MPRTTVNATRYAYVDEGEGDLLLFGHGLLASKKMFRANEALKDRCRCESIDWPGHGESLPGCEQLHRATLPRHCIG